MPVTLLPRAAAVSGLLVAALVHASVVDEQLRGWWLTGVVFVVLQMSETALAFVLVAQPSRRVCRTAIAVSLSAQAVWALPSTAPVRGTGLVASALELATAMVLLPLAGQAVRAAVVAGVVSIGLADYAGNRVAATALAVGQPAGGHVHAHGGPLRPGEYPLGQPLRRPLVAHGRGFHFAAWPLRRVVVELGVGPDTTGVNTFDVVVVDYAGKRIELADVRVTARPAGSALRPLRFTAGRLSPGHFVVDVARLDRAGTWLVQVEGRRTTRGRPLFAHTFAVQVEDATA